MSSEGIISSDEQRAQVTFSRHTIHNPAEPRHYMRLRPVPGRIRILRDGVVLADSDNAVRLLEAGKDIYDPALYIPRDDVTGNLSQLDKETFCPLKGHADYFDLVSEDGETLAESIAWTYERALDFAAALRGHIAFYPNQVVVEEHPPAAQDGENN